MPKFSRHNTKASKLSGIQVLEIRDKYALYGWTQRRLAREYSVSLTTISNIVNGLTWQSIPQTETEEDKELEIRLSMERMKALLNVEPENQVEEEKPEFLRPNDRAKGYL